MHHDLKCDPIPFGAALDGWKRHECRKADRVFDRGDTVTLHEYHGHFTGRELTFGIGFVTRAGEYGVAAGWCVFTLIDQPKGE